MTATKTVVDTAFDNAKTLMEAYKATMAITTIKVVSFLPYTLEDDTLYIVRLADADNSLGIIGGEYNDASLVAFPIIIYGVYKIPDVDEATFDDYEGYMFGAIDQFIGSSNFNVIYPIEFEPKVFTSGDYNLYVFKFTMNYEDHIP